MQGVLVITAKVDSGNLLETEVRGLVLPTRIRIDLK